MLCQTCQSIFCDIPTAPSWERLLFANGPYTSTHGVQQSAIKGCYICRCLWGKLTIYSLNIPAEHEFRVIIKSAVKGDIVEFELEVGLFHDDVAKRSEINFALGKSISLDHSFRSSTQSIISVAARSSSVLLLFAQLLVVRCKSPD